MVYKVCPSWSLRPVAIKALMVAVSFAFCASSMGAQKEKASNIEAGTQLYSVIEKPEGMYFFHVATVSSTGNNSFAGLILIQIQRRDNNNTQTTVYFRADCSTGRDRKGPSVQYLETSDGADGVTIEIDPRLANPPDIKKEPYALWRALCERTVKLPQPIFLSEEKSDIAFVQYENRDIHGADIRVLKNVDVKLCVNACRLDSKCRAYSFDRWNKWCFLKSSVSSLTLDPSSITGVRAEAERIKFSDSPNRMDRRSAKIFVGQSLATAVASSTDDCEQKCAAEEECLGYSYRASDRSCRMFSSIDTFKPDRSTTSGAKTQNPP